MFSCLFVRFVLFLFFVCLSFVVVFVCLFLCRCCFLYFCLFVCCFLLSVFVCCWGEVSGLVWMFGFILVPLIQLLHCSLRPGCPSFLLLLLLAPPLLLFLIQSRTGYNKLTRQFEWMFEWPHDVVFSVCSRCRLRCSLQSL